jgi:hypothetical protein
MQRKLQNFLRTLSKLSVQVATVGLMVLRLGPSTQAEASPRVRVDDRIQRIRVALNERSSQSAEGKDGREPGEIKLAQWGNWGNWANWNNWRNWGNWGNWGNI